MALSASDYSAQLKALLPPGPAWDGIDDLLLGLAQELARIDARAWALITEIDPGTTTELLAEWERVAGLPEPCSSNVVLTIEQRRTALVTKLTHTGGASRQFFIDLAAANGMTITITDLVTPYYWQVNAALGAVTPFRVGVNRVGDRLRTWASQSLECLITTHKPAHTVIIFAYA